MDIYCFWFFTVLTLVGLVATLVTGRCGFRKYHLRLAPLTIGFLVITIVFAERLAMIRDFPEEEMRIHLYFAWSAAILVFPVVASGLGYRAKPALRKVHLVCVILFTIAAVAATSTGIWVYSMSTPKVG